MTDERLKQLMEQVGMPNSRSLYQALQQAETEGVASRDAEVAPLETRLEEKTAECQSFYEEAERVIKQRDQLREQVTELQGQVGLLLRTAKALAETAPL